MNVEEQKKSECIQLLIIIMIAMWIAFGVLIYIYGIPPTKDTILADPNKTYDENGLVYEPGQLIEAFQAEIVITPLLFLIPILNICLLWLTIKMWRTPTK